MVRGAAAVALNPPVTSNAAPAAVPNLPSAPTMGPPAQLDFIGDEEVEEDLEELEQQIETAKQERDAALQELEQVEAQEAANKKTANKTKIRRQPSKKVKTQSKSKKGKVPKKGHTQREAETFKHIVPLLAIPTQMSQPTRPHTVPEARGRVGVGWSSDLMIWRSSLDGRLRRGRMHGSKPRSRRGISSGAEEVRRGEMRGK